MDEIEQNTDTGNLFTKFLETEKGGTIAGLGALGTEVLAGVALANGSLLGGFALFAAGNLELVACVYHTEVSVKKKLLNQQNPRQQG